MSLTVANGWRGRIFAALIVSVPLSSGSANSTPTVAPETGLTLAGAGLQVMLQTSKSADSGMRAFYAARNYRPLWISNAGMTPAGTALIKTLGQANLWGLNADDYAVPNSIPTGLHGAWTATEMATMEIAMSKAALAYARDARGARISDPSKQLASYIDRTPKLPDGNEVLTRLSGPDGIATALTSFHPQHEQFRRLQKIYAKALGGDDSDDTPMRLPQRGPMLSTGMHHRDVVTLRQILNVPAERGNADLYDSDLRNAVKAFQRSRGLSADGYVGPKTRLAFNGGQRQPTNHLQTIRANMEQWRWMPKTLGERHILVNIPEFKFAYYEDDHVVHEERVIVGANDTQTPLFSHRMTTIVLRPEWYMPDSIKLDKLLSAQRRGRTLESMGYKVKRNGKSIDSWKVRWARANISAYTVYQPSGSSNALGLVKFLFPNKHAVYLHDTPSKSLFSADTRTFSHGCIRVRDPLKLAEILLDRDKGEGAVNVNRIVRRGKDNVVYTLDQELPVHIVHMTAWANDDGSVSYFNDTYGHENRIKLALNGKWKSIDRGKDHLAALDTSDLANVGRLPAGKKRPRVVRGRNFPPPMGVTRIIRAPSYRYEEYGGSNYEYRPRRSSVGDLIRQGFRY